MRVSGITKLFFTLGLVAAMSVLSFGQATQQSGVIAAQTTDCSVTSSCVILPLRADNATTVVQITGTFSATITFEVTSNGTTWAGITGLVPATGAGVTTATAAGIWQFSTAGFSSIRMRCSTYASGRPNIYMLSGSGAPFTASSVTFSGTISGNDAASATGAAVPADAGYTGVNVSGNNTGVTGTSDGGSVGMNVHVNNASAIPVSAASLPLPTGASTAAKQDTGNTSLASIDSSTSRLLSSASAVDGSASSATTALMAGGIYNSTPPVITNGKQIALQVDANGALKTSGSISGVAQGSTTSGQSVLPSGCATTTSAPTNTTAQTNMLSCDTTGALRITGASNGTVTQGSTTSGQSGVLTQGAVTTFAPTYTTAQTSPLSLNTSGELRVSCTGCSSSGSITSWGGGTLGAMANYGTSPGAVLVPGVNANVTNLSADAAIGSALTSNPVPMGCHNETSPTTIGNTQAGVPECDTTQHLIIVGTGTFAAQAAITAASGSIGSGAIASGALASGSIASGAFAAGSINSAIPDPCVTGTKVYFPVNVATATTTVVHAAVSSNAFYICSINLVVAAAQTISVIDGTGGTCGSGTPTGLMGGATAATGWSFAANGGISLGNGLGTIMKTSTTARDLCLITGQAQQISGTVAYVTAP